RFCKPLVGGSIPSPGTRFQNFGGSEVDRIRKLLDARGDLLQIARVVLGVQTVTAELDKTCRRAGHDGTRPKSDGRSATSTAPFVGRLAAANGLLIAAGGD